MLRVRSALLCLGLLGACRALPSAIPLADTVEGQAIEAMEQAKASTRAKVEHPFHVLKNVFKHRKTRYRGLAKNVAHLMTLFGLGNLMLARKRLLNLSAQGAS